MHYNLLVSISIVQINAITINNKMNRSKSVHVVKTLTGISATNFTGRKEKKQDRAKLAILTLFLLSPFFVLAQSVEKDSLLTEVTLKNAIGYAILHQPKIQQSLVARSS